LRLRALLAIVSLVFASLASPACTKKGDTLVLAGDGSRLSSEQIDKDPIALLPGGAIGVTYVDLQAAFASQVGPAAVVMAASALPLGVDANFDARRDLSRVYVGMYSFQGVDAAAIFQGNFDPDAIRASVDRRAPTLLGAPITKLSYAGNDLYVAGGVGFVVVTKKTVIAGNETGIRRCLDRIRDKHVRRDISEWMAQLLENPKAAVVGAADLTSQPEVAGAAQQLPFLSGLRIARVLGNFEPPGINIAGALTYPDPASAQAAGQSVQRIAQWSSYAALLSLIGIRPPIQDMQVRTEQNDVQFIIKVDAQGASGMMDAVSQQMRSQPR
jgi:hypothetical protein